MSRPKLCTPYFGIENRLQDKLAPRVSLLPGTQRRRDPKIEVDCMRVLLVGFFVVTILRAIPREQFIILFYK